MSMENRPLDQLKVAELRDELRRRGLSLKGVKKDLFERLDEAVRMEQAGLVGDKEVQPGQSSGLLHDENTVETSQDDDGMSYLNDVENTQDTPLIVKNASPYVGASDAAPVFMETHEDIDRMPAMEERKDVTASDGGSLQTNVTDQDKVVPEPENIAHIGNPVLESDIEAVGNVAEPGNQGSGSEAILDSGSNQATEANATLPEISSQDTAIPNSLGEGGVSDGITVAFAQEFGSTNDTVLLEPADDGITVTKEFGSSNDTVVSESDGITVTKEFGSSNDTVVSESADGALSSRIGDAIVAVKSAISAQEFSGAEIPSVGAVVIPPEGDKDAPSASVSDDISNAADAIAPAVETVVTANDIPMQDVEVFERTVLTSVSVVVQDSGKELEDDALKIGISEKVEEELVEVGIKEGGLQERAEALEDLKAAPKLPMMEAGQESPVRVSEKIHAITVQPDADVQKESLDVEMSEAHENLSTKQVFETEPSPAILEALERPEQMRSNNVGVVDGGKLKEASRGDAVDERKSIPKSEPREAESLVSRRAMPVESVKVEQQDSREDLEKNERVFERLRSDRVRHNSARSFDERGRVEGRSGRHFKEDGRKDMKETIPKPEEGSDFRTGQKRREDDRDAKLQEPAKRVRRWNSGNQPTIEVAKPLTSGTVNEIVSPEVKIEDFSVVHAKLTPKLSGPVRPPVAKLGSEANGEKRAVPPSARPPSASLKIERFVRPFTLKAVKDLLAEFGECVDFWMDQIKTHCYVTFAKVDEAVAARNGLYDRQWPPSFGNLLLADFVDSSEVKMRSDGTFEKVNVPAATTPRSFPTPPPFGAQHGHLNANALASAPPMRERQFFQAPVRDPEPPAPTLDDLFRKTKAKPHIYYLPLTDEQVAEKLVAAKNKDQQLVRGRPIGRM